MTNEFEPMNQVLYPAFGTSQVLRNDVNDVVHMAVARVLHVRSDEQTHRTTLANLTQNPG
jgi:hypothetical protein